MPREANLRFDRHVVAVSELDKALEHCRRLSCGDQSDDADGGGTDHVLAHNVVDENAPECPTSVTKDEGVAGSEVSNERTQRTCRGITALVLQPTHLTRQPSP